MEMIEGCYLVRDAASLMGIRYKTLLKRINRGTVTTRKIGPYMLVPQEEVTRLIEEKKQELVNK